MTEAKVKAAVIGSGFGGLSAAIRLQAAGIETTLFEAMSGPGGRARSFTDQGFVFDAGPTVITVPSCIEELYDLAGERMSDSVDLLPVSPFYRLLWHDGDRFDYGLDIDTTLEMIRQRNPADAEGYLKFLEYSRKNYEAGYTELVSTAFLKFRDMMAAAPSLITLRSDRAVYKSVAKFVKDDRLREALSFHTLLIGGNPFETSSIYTLIHYLERQWGVHFPRGGTGALVRALVELFERLGGTILFDTPVRKVEVEESDGKTTHRVTADGWEGPPFDLTVSNADLHHTYTKIFGHDDRARPMVRKLERMTWSMSLFVLYFGVDRVYDDLAHHSIIFGPRYKGLLQDIFHGSELPEDFSLYLHAPTVTDPSLAPEGSSTFYVLSPVPHLGRAKIDWSTQGTEYGDRILEYLERFLPDLREHVVVRSHFTPEDFESRLGAYMGNGFSVAPLLTQSAYMRPHNRDPRIPGLYIVGAGTHPGAGVPGVINSAKATARVVLNDLGMS